jgi:hypothetical protein
MFLRMLILKQSYKIIKLNTLRGAQAKEYKYYDLLFLFFTHYIEKDNFLTNKISIISVIFSLI